MKWLTSWLERALRRFKERLRDWCRSPATVQEILLYPPLAVWLADQPPEARMAVTEALPKVLDYMADKWFGG